MDLLAAASYESSEVSQELEEKLVGPFVEAVMVTFAEMAGMEVVPLASFQRPRPTALGDISAVIRFVVGGGALILGFPRATALAVSKRILASVTDEVEEGLMQDCLGELANVVAGQAKTLLAGTPYHFTFSTPTVVSGSLPEVKFGGDCLAMVFQGEAGEFALQVSMGEK